MGAYGTVEDDTVAYGLVICVRMHDTWARCEGHDMICMLLTGCMVHICQYKMYEGGQERTSLA
jgi:hypothetical protein